MKNSITMKVTRSMTKHWWTWTMWFAIGSSFAGFVEFAVKQEVWLAFAYCLAALSLAQAEVMRVVLVKKELWLRSYRAQLTAEAETHQRQVVYCVEQMNTIRELLAKSEERAKTERRKRKAIARQLKYIERLRKGFGKPSTLEISGTIPSASLDPTMYMEPTKYDVDANGSPVEETPLFINTPEE